MDVDHLRLSVAELAAVTAKNLAKESLRDRELREAIRTEPIIDGVRIGKWDIVLFTSDIDRFYDIRSQSGEILFEQIAFYDTARRIVGLLNDGITANSYCITQLIFLNGQYRRAKADQWLFTVRLRNQQNEDRTWLFENRLSNVTGRVQHLQSCLRG